MSKSSAMIPSAYAHFLAKLETACLRNLETTEKMREEGACDPVLEALARAQKALDGARTSIKFAKALREQELDDQSALARATRQAENEARKAKKQTSKASKPAVSPQVSQEAGPQGPPAL